jgi:hypothetical protein
MGCAAWVVWLTCSRGGRHGCNCSRTRAARDTTGQARTEARGHSARLDCCPADRLAARQAGRQAAKVAWWRGCRNPAQESSWAIKTIKAKCQGPLPTVPTGAFIPQNSTRPDIYPGARRRLHPGASAAPACQRQTHSAAIAVFFSSVVWACSMHHLPWARQQHACMQARPAGKRA